MKNYCKNLQGSSKTLFINYVKFVHLNGQTFRRCNQFKRIKLITFTGIFAVLTMIGHVRF